MRKHIGWIVGGIIMIIGVFGYISGYRITNSFSIKKVGTITVVLPLRDTSIFFDNKNVYTSSKDDEVAIVPISPHKQPVIVSRVSYFPWRKDIEIPSGGDVKLFPLLVSQNPSGEIINNSDKEYWKIKNDIKINELPTKVSPLAKEGAPTIWVENNSIIAKEGDKVFTVVEPQTVIKNVSFYKNRTDAIIFSAGNGVYVIETDTENFQNFMPIYKGTNPHFIPNNEGTIYVEDGNALMLVII